MNKVLTALFVATIAAGTLASCSNDPTVSATGVQTNGSNILFQQVDRIGKPGIKELYLPFSVHAAYNGATPENDQTAYGGSIASFVTTAPASRSAAIGTYVEALLTPDALIADLGSNASRASYLGWETSGQLNVDCTGLPGTTFGGRALEDDVVDAMLGLAFGNLATSATLTAGTPNVFPPGSTATASPLAPPPDDGADKNGANGTPNLTKQNVACSSKGETAATFPYLGAPL